MLGRGTVSKLLTGAELRPHKIEYYLERRDPAFDTKMAQIMRYLQDLNADPVVFRWRDKIEEESVS